MYGILYWCRIRSQHVRTRVGMNEPRTILFIGLTVLFPEPAGPMTLGEIESDVYVERP